MKACSGVFSIFQTCIALWLSHASAKSTDPYPVPIPAGGRMDVHGWLILPLEQISPADPSLPITAWFSHHVPEIYYDSPHNFQIILKGELSPISCVQDEYFPFQLPSPPLDELLVHEYSFTPPNPFSLNDLLSGSITSLNGVFYNGSFDTSYERQATSLATLKILELTTAVYLDEYDSDAFHNLRYLSYPRQHQGVLVQRNKSTHFYLSHEIKVQPDFDHIVHATFENCSSDSEEMYAAGSSWEFEFENILQYKLEAGQKASAKLLTGAKAIVCDVIVLESIHCMIGPGFMENC